MNKLVWILLIIYTIISISLIIFSYTKESDDASDSKTYNTDDAEDTIEYYRNGKLVYIEFIFDDNTSVKINMEATINETA